MHFKRLLLLLVAAAAIAAIVVPAADALAFPDDICPVESGGTVKICPQGQTGKPYSLQIQGRDGTGCVPYVTFRAIGELPTGLSMSSSGLISGTPTQAGEWTFWIEMKDIPASEGGVFWCADSKSTERQFSITIVQGLQILQRQSTLTAAQLNTTYSLQFTAAGSTSPTWSVSAGSLPGGLTLSSSGLLSGTPTTEGDYSFKVTATEGSRSDTQTYSMSVVPKLQISIGRSAAEVGVSFQLAPQATGGKPGYTWSLDSGTALPAGLTLDTSSGAITGIPAAAGHTAVKLAVTDSLGLKTTLDVPITVVPRLLLLKKTLRTAKVGTAYNAVIAKTGGARPFKWSVRGAPQGLRFSAKAGRLIGVARAAGSFRLRVNVTDALGATATRTFVLKVVS
jgi:large repetitive protein